MIQKKATSRKFKSYKALCESLRRTEIHKYGLVSTLLFEAFLENNGRILASQVVARGICEEGKFKELRKDLIQKDWLVWSETQTDKGQYYPGKKLIPYLNREKLSSKEIVTKDEVASKLDVQDLKERMCKMEEAMTKVYNNLNLGPVDPPGYSKLIENSAKVN